MSNVLDQSEIDALLAAAMTEETPAAPTPSSSGGGGDRMAGPAESSEPAVDYDFKRPERVSKDQMRAMQSVHESFARNLGASLSTFLRTIVETRVARIEQLTYSEFINSLPSPTCFNLLTGTTLPGKLCLEISPLIIYPIVDRLLGGTNAEMFIPQRPLTEIELRLANRIIDRALDCLSEAWTDLLEVKFKVSETESNPHLVQIVAPNEIVVVVGFEIKMGARAGTMSLCIPFNAIEPVIGKLATQSWLAYSRKETDKEQVRRVLHSVRRATIRSCAYLGETQITVGELVALAPGDILRLDKTTDRDFILRIEGKTKFAGRLGKLRGNRAIRITRRARPDDSL